MLAFSDVFHFFAHKLASLSAGGLAFALVLSRTLDHFFFRHNKKVSPLTVRLDVNKYRKGLATDSRSTARLQRVYSRAVASLIDSFSTIFDVLLDLFNLRMHLTDQIVLPLRKLLDALCHFM